jgi:PHD/YefM family antitoxin component YafN of YafNO toxin-antitoxin module
MTTTNGDGNGTRQALGRPGCPEDLERLEETLEIMRDAATMNRLAESDADLARGEHVSTEELAEAMRQRRAQ